MYVEATKPQIRALDKAQTALYNDNIAAGCKNMSSLQQSYGYKINETISGPGLVKLLEFMAAERGGG